MPAAGSVPLAASWWRRLRSYGLGPVICSAAMIILLGTRQSFIVPYTGLGVGPGLLLMLLGGALWLTTQLAGQRNAGRGGAVGTAVLLFTVSVLLSYAVANLSSDLSDTQRADAQQSLSTIGIVLLFFCFGISVLRTTRQLEFVLRCLLLGATLCSIYAIVKVGTGIDLGNIVRLPGTRSHVSLLDQLVTANFERLGVSRPTGTAGSSLELGALSTVAIPIGIGVSLAARRRGERSWPWELATVLCAGGAAVSLSRSAVIGVAAALAVMIWRWPWPRVLTLLGGVTVAVVIAWLSGSKVLSALWSLLTKGSQDGSLQSRSYGRNYVYLHVAQHLWLGQGFGTYDRSTQPILDSQFLDTVVESGVLGLLAFAGLLATGALVAYRVHALIETWGVPNLDPTLSELASGVCGALTVLIAVNFVLDTFGFIQTTAVTWMLLTIAAAARAIAATPPALSPPQPDRFARRHHVSHA